MKPLTYLLLFAFGFAAAAVAEGERTVLEHGFEKGQEDCLITGSFAVVDGEGIGASRAAVWKQGAPGKVWSTARLRLRVEPGRIYRYSGMVRSKGIAGDYGYVNFRWCDSNGRQLGVAEGRPHIRRQVGVNGWEKVSGASVRLPAGAVWGYVYPSVSNLATGELYFDDFKVTEGERRYVEYIHTSVYGNRAKSGEVKFVSPYIGDSGAGYRATFVCEGADGREIRLPARFLPTPAVEASVDVGRLKPGKSRIRLEFDDEKGRRLDEASVDFERLGADSGGKVGFDCCGRTLLDGKPFFPLGMYIESRITEEELDIYAESSFNTMLASGDFMLREAAKRGLKVICGSVGATPEAAAATARRLKDHPALLAYYIADEPPPGLLAQKKAVHDALKAEDPDHPTYIVLDKTYHVRMFMPACDVVGIDTYPIGYNAMTIDSVGKRSLECAEEMFGFRAMWHVPQAFNWHWGRKNRQHPDFRFPTEQECRSFVWQSIAAGANGIVWYSFSWMRSELKDRPDEFAEYWGRIKRVSAEVAEFAPEIAFGRPGPRPKRLPEGILVRTAKGASGAAVVLVVNSTRDRKEWTLPIGGSRSFERLLLGAKPVAAKGGLALDLPPLGVAMFTVK